MQYLPDGTEIVLWGLGEVGKRVLTGEFGNYKICFAIDRKWTQRQAELAEMGNTENITVYPSDIFDEISLGNKVLVISTYKWMEIAESLEKKGKHIFRDYVPYIYLKYDAVDIDFYRFCKDDNERKICLEKLSFGKKTCALYGFCHMSIYKSLLLESKEFREKYCLLNLPIANNRFQHNFNLLNMPHIYSDLDLLILGLVYPLGGLGTPDWRTIKSWVNEDCEVILVTPAFFKGYFPQHAEPIQRISGQLRWGDKNLNKMIRDGMAADEILHILSSPDFYSAEAVNRWYENALKQLEQTESVCDIRIGDYIRKYGKQKSLMYGSNHPCQCVLKELTIRIFRKLGLDTEPVAAKPEKDFPLSRVHRSGEFIYPSVYHALGITEREDNEKVHVGFDIKARLEFPEYINLYVKLYKPYLCEGSKAEASPR